MFVQAFLLHPPVEAFDHAVLHWLSPRDVLPVDLAGFLPLQHRVTGQFRAVVRDHHAGIATQLGDTIQFASNSHSSN